MAEPTSIPNGRGGGEIPDAAPFRERHDTASKKTGLMRAVAKKRKSGGGARPPRDAEGRAGRAGLVGLIAAILLALGFAGAALVYDSQADASFDAPKRLVSLLAIGAAALAVFGFGPPWTNPFAGGRLTGWRDRRISLALFLFAAAATVVSAVVSPRRELALDSLRAAALVALLLPLGASPGVARRLPLLVAAFLAAAGVDAVVSILQAVGAYQPFPLVTHGDREATGAFAGNVGYLALALALGAVAAAGLAMTRRSARVRVVAAALVVLFGLALVVNRNLTALSALAAGVAVLAFGLFGRRAILPLAAAVLAGGLAVSFYPPMRARAAEIRRAVRAGDWDAILSYRTGAWLAAVRMARERPLVGYGPGTFGAEFVRHRLDAEIAARRRLTTPLATATYGEAHDDYLQPFAEEGAPAAVALIAAAGLVVAATARRAAKARGPDRTNAVLLLGFLAAGGTAALTWFPLQRPITALPLLFALGLAWRRSDAGPSSSAPDVDQETA
jgi:O-antigen ligase